MCQMAIPFGSQVLVVALAKGLECETKAALDETLQWAVALTEQGCQPYAVVMTLKAVDLVAVTALGDVGPAVDPVLHKHHASAVSSDAYAPSADITVVEAPAVEAQGPFPWLLLQTSWIFSAVVLSASL